MRHAALYMRDIKANRKVLNLTAWYYSIYEPKGNCHIHKKYIYEYNIDHYNDNNNIRHDEASTQGTEGNEKHTEADRQTPRAARTTRRVVYGLAIELLLALELD